MKVYVLGAPDVSSLGSTSLSGKKPRRCRRPRRPAHNRLFDAAGRLLWDAVLLATVHLQAWRLGQRTVEPHKGQGGAGATVFDRSLVWAGALVDLGIVSRGRVLRRQPQTLGSTSTPKERTSLKTAGPPVPESFIRLSLASATIYRR